MVNLVKQFVIFGNFNNITFNNTTDPIHKLASELGFQLVVKQDPEVKVFAGNSFESPYRPTLLNDDHSVTITFNSYKIIINIENYSDEKIIDTMPNYLKKITKFIEDNYEQKFYRIGVSGLIALDASHNEFLYNKFFINSKIFTQNKNEWSVREVQNDIWKEINEQTNVVYSINKIIENNVPFANKPMDIDLSLCLSYDINTLQKYTQARFNGDYTTKFLKYANEALQKVLEFVGD